MQNFFILAQNPTERLIELLKKTGKNQPELADLLPVSVSTISRWFSGSTSHISKDKRELIANIMGFDLKWIETGRSQDQVADDLKAIDAGQVVLPESGKLSRDQMRELLGQIESIVRIMKDSL